MIVFDNAYEFHNFIYDKPTLLQNPTLKQFVDLTTSLRGGNCQCNMKDQSIMVGEIYSRVSSWLTHENQIEIKLLLNNEPIIIKHFNQEILIF